MPKKGFFEDIFEIIQKKITDRIGSLPGKTVLDKIFYFEATFDSQFLSLQKIVENLPLNPSPKQRGKLNRLCLEKYIMFLIIQNALICYQLSGTGEDYWEEFSGAIITSPLIPLRNREGKFDFYKKTQNFEKYYLRPYEKNFFESDDEFREKNLEFREEFLSGCKNNRRLNRIKLGRIQKSLDLRPILSDNFFEYYKDMGKLCNLIGETMNQKNNAKTVVFSIKMFSYIARVIYKQNISMPFEVEIPIDSRLIQYYQEITGRKESIKNSEIREFYIELSKYLQIPALHLDALLWVK